MRNLKVNGAIMAGVLALAGASILGCAGAPRSESVEAKAKEAVAQEKPTSNPGELAARGFEAWSAGAGLSADQKSKLYVIHTSTAREAFRIRDEISKNKSALYKELAKGEYNPKMVEVYKNKIISLDRERIDIMLKALARVEGTLGRGAEAQKYYEYLDKIETQYFRNH